MPVLTPSRLLPARLDPFAARVIEQLSRSGYAPSQDVDQIRRQYALARTPLLAAEEEMASVETIAGQPSLIILRPHDRRNEQALRPALVFFHGGGWVLGGFDTYGPLARQLARATGRIVIFVDYRLAPEHPFPAAIEDAFAALEWVSAHAAALGIDKNQIAVGGDSAGGNLAAVAALAVRDGLIEATLQFQLLIYPCLDMTARQPSHAELASGYLLTREIYTWYRDLYVGGVDDLTDWRLSPLFAASLRDVAPAIVLYAGFDPLRDEALVYCSRLVDAGVAVEPIFYPGMIHGFMTMGGVIPPANEAVHRIAAVTRKWEKYPSIHPMAARANTSRPAILV